MKAHHPHKHKLAMFQTLVNKIYKLCSKQSTRQKEINKIKRTANRIDYGIIQSKDEQTIMVTAWISLIKQKIKYKKKEMQKTDHQTGKAKLNAPNLHILIGMLWT